MQEWIEDPKHQPWVSALLIIWIMGTLAIYLICYGPPEFESFFSRLGFETEFADARNQMIAYFYQFWKYISL